MVARARISRGFTLVELLVVITIIGMLVTLAVTGVQYAKKAAQRARCTNYQSDLGKGIMAFETAKGYFPGFIQQWKGRPVNWVVMVLEFTDHKDVWDRGWRDQGSSLTDAQSLAALKINSFLCPADSTNNDAAPLSYVINARISRDLSQPATREANKRSSSDIQTASTTPLLAERLKNTPFVTGPWVNISGTTATANVTMSPLTFVWPTSGMAQSVLSSTHGNGALVTFCDGRTEYVADNVNCNVYLPGPN